MIRSFDIKNLEGVAIRVRSGGSYADRGFAAALEMQSSAMQMTSSWVGASLKRSQVAALLCHLESLLPDLPSRDELQAQVALLSTEVLRLQEVVADLDRHLDINHPSR